MDENELYAFLRSKRYGVIATVAEGGAPQAALVGIAITPRLEIILDTVGASRKAHNLRRQSQVAVVIVCAG